MENTPQVTPTQKAASEWTGHNWTEGFKLAGADSNYVAFWAFCAGAEYAALDVAGPLQTRISELNEIRVRVVDERDKLRHALEYANRRIREGCVSDAAQAIADALCTGDESVCGPSAGQADDILGKSHYNAR